MAKETVIVCDKCGTREDVNVKMSLRQIHDDGSGWTERKDLCGQCTIALLYHWFDSEAAK